MNEQIYATGSPVTVNGNALSQRRVVTASWSGHNAGLVSRVGDWTWDVAHRFCGVAPYTARNAEGKPSYLFFCYFRLRGCGGVHVRSFGLGAVVDVRSTAFSPGPSALYTVHCITPAGAPSAPLDLARLRAAEPSGTLYAETYNRWVSRSAGDSNESLVKAVPPEFRNVHLPELPPEHHPRAALRRSRETGSFADPDGLETVHRTTDLVRDVNVARDINGVDLLYYASYFSIVDEALLSAWEAAGRDKASFLARHPTEQRIAYFGNADFTSRLRVGTTLRRHPDRGWVFDGVIARDSDDEVIAVATQWFDVPTAHDADRHQASSDGLAIPPSGDSAVYR